ncbi:MAG: DUF1810 domain-containing protein [Mycobacterium sp.]
MDSASDPFELKRFVDAQARTYDTAVAELSAGRKRSHWMWFIFPQLRGLGSSAMATHFGISGLEEARAYLDHPVLGPRLHECAQLLNRLQLHLISDIMGRPDDMKLGSSMTLFARATDDNEDFVAVLKKYFGGGEDPRTVARLTAK